MRTTLRQRKLSSPNSWNTSQSFKRRKLNPNHNSNVSLSFDTTQLQALHRQLMAMKNKHCLKKDNVSDHRPEPTQSVAQTVQNHKEHNTKINKHKTNINNHKSEQKQSVKPTEQSHQRKQPIKNSKKPKAKNKRITAQNVKRSDSDSRSTDVEINNFLEIDEHQNNHSSNQNDNEHEDDDWNTFINSVDFNSKKKTKQKPKNAIHAQGRETPNKSSLISTATATEDEWYNFLDKRYDENNERTKDWVEPEIHTFWERGPIGLVSNWWNDHTLTKCADDNEDDLSQSASTKKIELSAADLSKKKQNKLIKIDVMKELKQQRLEKRLRDRMQFGEIVQNMDEANNPFESFFTSALEMGQNIRDGNIMETLSKQNEQKTKKKTKIFQPKLKKIKTIATFENDDLFFIDTEQSDEEEEEEDNDKVSGQMMQNINENDMIHLHENSVGNNIGDGYNVNPAVAAKVHSEQILLKQRVEMQHKEITMNVNDNNDTNTKKNKLGVVPSNILSNTVEDSWKEKKILKKLNVMDFVSNYKDAFFREVEELNLNVSALVDNWEMIKKHDGLSRKLRKKLGIIMARERKRRAKQNKMQQMIEQMTNESEESEDTESSFDGDNSDNDSDIECFLNE